MVSKNDKKNQQMFNTNVRVTTLQGEEGWDKGEAFRGLQKIGVIFYS